MPWQESLALGVAEMDATHREFVEFAEQLRLIAPEMVPVNFLNPLPGTRFAGRPLMAADEALTTVAAFRFMLPDRNLMAAGGKEADIAAGIAVAERSIDSGAARGKLERLVDFCQG